MYHVKKFVFDKVLAIVYSFTKNQTLWQRFLRAKIVKTPILQSKPLVAACVIK